MRETAAGEEWVDVAAFTAVVDAEMAASALEAAEIDVHVANTAVVGMLPYASNAFGGVVVRVPASDAARAREILSSPASAPPPEAASADEPAFPEGDAPVVDDARTILARRAWRAAVLGLALMPVVLHLLSLWNLARFVIAPGPAPRRARRLALGALVVDVLFLGGLALLVAYAAARAHAPRPPIEYHVIPIGP